ncbi:hypothetical protein [Kutzneria sp. 744]|uniref:hypothetical protein n=1 Tax=Kutzneria sp. (strain 744) TaxID=345341 RepID=UPI0003EEC88B|nr:hypothetical protein [Kutzneria sp. 744]EWM19049.1 hypothetical protein KUTG_09353 [Kutzneria sp. 744]
MGMDIEWATSELDAFLKLAELYRPPAANMPIASSRMSNRGSRAEIVASAQVVEQILDRVLPNWRHDVPSDRNKTTNIWWQHVEAVQRARTMLQRQTELQEKLGDNAPLLNAAHLHRVCCTSR